MSIRNNYPTVNPTLDLDFANTRRLDPRVTFTRSSTATYYDGSKALAEQNLLLNSQTFNTTWVASSITLATGITDPLGTTTAYTATASGANATVFQSVIIPADTFTFSIYIQRVTGTGTINLTLDGTTMTVASVTGSWVRYTATQTLTAGTYTVGIQIVTSGDAVNIWGAQLEQRSSASAYNVTTTSIVANYISVLKTAAINQPRFDVDPVTGESKGLLIEESKTNLLTYSEQFDNAVWAKTNATVTANAIVAPDGTITADKLVESATNTAHYIRQFPSITTSVVFSVYAKASERTKFQLDCYDATNGTRNAVFNLVSGTVETILGTGVTANITALSNGWYRCCLILPTSATGGDCKIALYTSSNTYTGDGTSGIYIWGAQLEQGAFPTSYIPTTSAQVTRSSDNASMTGTAFSSWYNQSEGTIYSEWILGKDIVSSQVYNINDGTSSNYIRNRYNSIGIAADNAVVISDVAQTILESTNQITIDSTYKNAMAYKQNDFARSSSGTLITDNLGNLPTVNQLNLGATILTTGYLNGHIKSIRYYPARVTNAQLQALTSI